MIAAEGGVGRAVAAVPLAHVLLLPRSLFVLTHTLYADHLHGIATRERDVCFAPGVERGEKMEIDEAGAGAEAKPEPVVVANAELLGRPDVQAALASPDGWAADRGTRTSLTFRRAEKVLKGGAFALVGGKLRRG
jgi:alkylated DNA repair protein alkB family protein 6